MRVISKTQKQPITELMPAQQQIGDLEESELEQKRIINRPMTEAEDLYRKMIEFSPDGIITVDMKGVIRSCNTAETTMLGYSKDELVGNHFSKLGVMRLMDFPKYMSLFTSALKGEITKPLELTFYRKDGTPILIDVRINLLNISGNTILQATSRDITERKRAEHDMRERIKELDCLGGIASIAAGPHITLNEMYQKVVNLLPKSWQYPEIACARVTLGEKEFKTDNFNATAWKQSADINMENRKEGTVEVYYLKARPELDEGPFLKEERQLINTIGGMLGSLAERKQMEDLFKVLTLNSPVGIYIIL
ncbi:PAS domain S-box protein [Chloroflexota bacterium]